MTYFPFFSIIIPTYNSFITLQRALISLQNQTFQNFEIIIVDDGSSDNTDQNIQSYLDEKTHYYYKTNGGSASARNVAIEHSKGKYLCFLDADDEFMPDKLEQYYSFCQKNHLFLFSDAVYIDDNKKVEYLFSTQTQWYEGLSFPYLMKNNFIVTSTVCIQRALLSQKPYFNESCFIEDYDLWLKIAQNVPITYIPMPLTRYHIHNSNQSNNTLKTLKALIKLYFQWSLVSLSAFKQMCKYTLVFLMYTTGVRK